MSTTLNDIYLDICDILLEPGGLQLGLVTSDDILSYASDALIDFTQRTGIYKQWLYLQALAYTGVYTLPDIAMEFECLFYDQEYLVPTDAFSIENEGYRDWQSESSWPEKWHRDRLPPHTFEVVPMPSQTGAEIPDNPVLSDAAMNLMALSSIRPSVSALTLDTVVEGIPDSLTYGLKYRILWKIFTSNAEHKDALRARYCGARYEECVSLAQTIMGEIVES